MKFGKPLDYSMMLTAPVWESLHWKSYKMPRPDRPDVTQPQDVGGAPRGADVGPGDGGGPPDVAQHLQRVRHGDRGLRADRSHRGARADNLALDVNISRTSHQLQFRLQFEEAWTTSQRR